MCLCLCLCGCVSVWVLVGVGVGVQLYMECVPGECPTLKGEEQYCTNMVITQRKFPATEVFYVSTVSRLLR